MSKATPSPAAPPKPGFVASLVRDVRDVTPVLALIPALVAGALMYGALGTYSGDKRIISYDKLVDLESGAWSGADFGSLAWVGLLVAIAVLLAGVRRERSGTLVMVGITGQLLFAAAVATFSIAWASGRQNYWDAYHFSTLAWTAFGSAAVAAVAATFASRRGSAVGPALQATSSVCVLLSFVVWLYSWNPWLQGLEGWIVRTLWLATHG